MSYAAVVIALFFVSGIVCDEGLEEGNDLVNCEGSLIFPPPLNEIKCARFIYFFPNYLSNMLFCISGKIMHLSLNI